MSVTSSKYRFMIRVVFRRQSRVRMIFERYIKSSPDIGQQKVSGDLKWTIQHINNKNAVIEALGCFLVPQK